MRAGSGSKPSWALIPPATPTSPQPGRGVCPGKSPLPAMVTISQGQTALLWQAWHRGTKWGYHWLGSGWWGRSRAHAEDVGRSGWEHPGWEGWPQGWPQGLGENPRRVLTHLPFHPQLLPLLRPHCSQISLPSSREPSCRPLPPLGKSLNHSPVKWR